MVTASFNFQSYESYQIWNKFILVATLVMQFIFFIINAQFNDLFPGYKIKMSNNTIVNKADIYNWIKDNI